MSFGFSPMGASRESQSSQVRKSITISVTGHALHADLLGMSRPRRVAGWLLRPPPRSPPSALLTVCPLQPPAPCSRGKVKKGF